MSVKMRQRIERRIVTRVVRDALQAGYWLGLDNGGDDQEIVSRDRQAVLEAMFATDEDRLFLYQDESQAKANGHCVGWVYFVYGNDGWDVISDYTTNLEALLKGAMELSDLYA